jgi:ABC-type uncharacterized transport system auxiliary subunit
MKKGIGILLLSILLSGCLGGTGKTPFIRQYVLEYPPPQRLGRPAVEAMVRVERFAADRMFMGQAMLYRQDPFLREAYPLHHWRVSPGDMVTEYLRRDLREAGLFLAVLAERDAEEVRFSLTGGVEEFLESSEGSNRKALLAATVTLLDLSRKETASLVVFQKTYRLEAPMAGEGAAELAAAMSRAMSDLSRQVIADIVSALGRAI